MSRLIPFIFLAATLFAAPSGFNGRWNLTVEREPKARAWWIEISGAGTSALQGRFIGAPGGQLDAIPEIRIEGDELIWAFERTYRRDADEKARQRGVYRARLENGLLIGSLTVEKVPDYKLRFTGRRAPVIKETDDGKWKPGAPVALFNGKDLAGWRSRVPGTQVNWVVTGGAVDNVEKAVDIVSEKKFWNFKLHAEFKVAHDSNSGIALRGRYEVAIQGDYGEPLSGHSNGAIYSRIVPAGNATLPEDQWQTFDITLIGREVTVVLNGKTIIDRKEIEGPTAMGHDPNEDQPGPISLQGDHGPVLFRKLVVTPLSR